MPYSLLPWSMNSMTSGAVCLYFSVPYTWYSMKIPSKFSHNSTRKVTACLISPHSFSTFNQMCQDEMLWTNGNCRSGWMGCQAGTGSGMVYQWAPAYGFLSGHAPLHLTLSHNPLLRISLMFSAYSVCVASQSATQLRILPCCPSKGPFWKSYQTSEQQKHNHETNPFDLEAK